VTEINPSSAVAQRHQPHREMDARDNLAPVHQSLRHEAWPMHGQFVRDQAEQNDGRNLLTVQLPLRLAAGRK
jgi:hypothetical protein